MDYLIAVGIVFLVTSCSAKVTAAMIGTFKLPPLWFAVAFLLCVDYLMISSFYWWLRKRTTQASQTRAQVSYIATRLSFVSILLFVVTIIGTIFGRWSLTLAVSYVVFLKWI